MQAQTHQEPEREAEKKPWPLGCIVGGGLAILLLLAAGGVVGIGVYRYLDSAKNKEPVVAQAPPTTPTERSTRRGGIREIKDAIGEDEPDSSKEDRPKTEPADPVTKPGDKPADTPRKPEPKLTPEERDLVPLLARLKSGTAEDRVEAANKLAQMGKKAQPAARALCEAATDPSQKVSRAALVALEKVYPELQQPIFVLLIDDQAANHVTALAKLDELGDKAKPGTPVVVHQIEKCQALLKEQLEGRGRTAWGAQTLFQVIEHNMQTLVKIGADEPETVKLLTDLTKFRTENPVFFGRRNRNGLYTIAFPFSLRSRRATGQCRG